MLDVLLSAIHDPSIEEALRNEVGRLTALLQDSRRPDAQKLVAATERFVSANPEKAFEFDDHGIATLATPDGTWSAGRFETASIAKLRDRVRSRPNAGDGRIRLSVLLGRSPVMDIGALQAHAGEGALFQVASQFNCLEAPGARIVPVPQYFSDRTQGPAASISAFPATLLRHYAAPRKDGARFVQTPAEQIDLLEGAFGRKVCRNGYFTGEGMSGASAVDVLEENFEEIEIGLHDEADVALGYQMAGTVPEGASRLGQVFTSTVAGGGYGGDHHLGESFNAVCRLLLRASYLGTLLAAEALNRRKVVLTLIGGGVFGNPVQEIWNALVWAIDEMREYVSRDLEIIVNGFDLQRRIPNTDLGQEVAKRAGGVAMFDGTSVAIAR